LSGNTATTHDTTWVFGGNLAKTFENTTVQVTVSRDIIPSGFGLLIQTDRVATTASHDLSETVTALFDASAYRVSGLTTRALGGTISDQRLFYLTPKVAWKFLEWWKIELSYTYRWRDSTDSQNLAMSNATMFTLTYYPPKLAFSR
jgi:hypothetical protein